MASHIDIDKIGEVGRQAQALGAEATPAINAALLAGAKIIAEEAKTRVPRSANHRTDHGRSPKHLADVLTAAIITKRKTAGVTVQGGANGPSYYWKFPEHGTVKMKAREYIAKSAEAREDEVLNTVAAKLKEKLGF